MINDEVEFRSCLPFVGSCGFSPIQSASLVIAGCWRNKLENDRGKFHEQFQFLSNELILEHMTLRASGSVPLAFEGVFELHTVNPYWEVTG